MGHGVAFQEGEPLHVRADSALLQTCSHLLQAVLVCNLLCIAASADGYQINLNGLCILLSPVLQPELTITKGNIIANLGFIRKVGFPDEKGEYYLKAEYTSFWGALQSLGQLIGMILLNPISDLIGRKMTLYLLWFVLVGVSRFF